TIPPGCVGNVHGETGGRHGGFLESNTSKRTAVDRRRWLQWTRPRGSTSYSIIRGHPIIGRSSSASIVRFEQIFGSLPRISIRAPKRARPYPWIFRILQSNPCRKRRSNGTRRTDSSRGVIFLCRG